MSARVLPSDSWCVQIFTVADQPVARTIAAALVTELGDLATVMVAGGEHTATLVVETIDDESVVQCAARLCAELDPAARRVHRSTAGPWFVETGDVVA